MVWNAERRNSDYLKKVQQHRNRSHKNMKKSPDKNFWAVTSQKGYSHVGDIVMLLTYSWWQFKSVGDRITILVTSFRHWCPTPMLWDKGCWWLKWLKPAPTSSNCHQHISSPTSVTNIDVAVKSFNFISNGDSEQTLKWAC